MAGSDTSSLVFDLSPHATPVGIPPEALDLLDRSPRGLRPLLKLLYSQDQEEGLRAKQRLVDQWAKPRLRAAAAPTAVPYLYGLLAPNGPQDLRSHALMHIGFIGLGFGADNVPHGFDGGAGDEDLYPGTGADARSAYAVVEATLPQVYPFLEDDEAPVRAQAARLLAFFPAARETAGPALLARVAQEPNTEVRSTVAVAAAMLYRGVADAAARAAVCAQLEQQWAAATTTAAQDQSETTTESDPANDAALARFTLALARCIVGVHTADDVETVALVLTTPFDDDKQLPREPDRQTLEPTLPFAFPTLKELAGLVLKRLPAPGPGPGPGPQPLAVVRVLAARVRHAPVTQLRLAIDATLNSACGEDAVPAAWPAFAALDERMQEAVRGLAKIDPAAFTLLRSRLERWRLPASAKGLEAYMGGTAAAVAYEQSQAELDKKLQKMVDKAQKRRGCCGFLSG